MNLIRLIYASRVSTTCDFEGLRAVLNSAYKNNPSRNLTGVLCYDPNYFLQWLEGPVEEVHDLYSEILRDDRHTEPVLLDHSSVTQRFFPTWAMAYLTTQAADQKLLFEYTQGQPFNPMNFSGPTACEFLIKLAAAKGQPLDPIIVKHPDIALAIQ